MPSLINPNKLITYKPYNDPAREAAMKQAYGLDLGISVANVNTADGNWVQCKLAFQTKANKKYILTEYFKEGDDNSTDHVILSYNKDNKLVETSFDKFVDAESAMVYLIEKEEE